MTGILEGVEQLERELTGDPIAAPAVGSIVLHAGLAAALVLYGVLGGLFHHNFWGSPGAGSAIQVSLVSNALPLPADHPTNENVLTTQRPSEAPAPPSPKAKAAIDETAIPISGKQQKAQPQKQVENLTKTQLHQPPPKQDNRAQFGEQAGANMPRATMSQPGAANAPVSVTRSEEHT